MKTWLHNDVINRIGLVYIKNDPELLRPIILGVVYDKTRQDNEVTDLPHTVYAENETKLSWLIIPGAVYHENQIGQWHDR